jgi:hypothetical protein
MFCARRASSSVKFDASRGVISPKDDPPMTPRSISAHLVARPLNNSLEPDQNSFGVVRLALAFMVLVSHAYFLKTGSTVAEPLITWTGYTLGQHAVQGFFVLSGLLVAQSLMRARAVSHFAIARALRIFPGLIVCVLVTAFVIGPLATTLTPAAYLGDGQLARYLAKTLSLMTGSAPLPGVFLANTASGVVNTSHSGPVDGLKYFAPPQDFGRCGCWYTDHPFKSAAVCWTRSSTSHCSLALAFSSMPHVTGFGSPVSQ